MHLQREGKVCQAAGGGLILLLLLGLAACARQEESSPPERGKRAPGRSADVRPAYGDALVEGVTGDASALLPMLATDSLSLEISALLYNGLVKYDRRLALTGDLARSWEISADGLTLTFHLRPGVRWHDGVALTAEDFLFGYRTITDPRTPTPYAADFREVRRVEVVDRDTLRVTYHRPFAPGLASWNRLVVLPRHLLEGQEVARSSLRHQPVGTGPYRLVEWKPGERIVLEANPHYFEGRPYLGRYIYRIFPDLAALVRAFQGGEIDLMTLDPAQSPPGVEGRTLPGKGNGPAGRGPFLHPLADGGKIPGGLPSGARIYRYPANAYTFLGYNLLAPRFQDRRVRQAISYALNRKEIIDAVLQGWGEEATGPYLPGTWAHHPQLPKYAYDPWRAQALLAEAGWRDTNRDGLLEQNGQPFRFALLTNRDNPVRVQTAQVIQRQLKAVGIAVELQILDWEDLLKELFEQRSFEAVILGWGIGPDPDQYEIWHSSRIAPPGLNFVSFAHPEVDALLEKGRSTFSQEERMESYRRLQEILAEEQPYAFLFVPELRSVVQARFRGIEPAPTGIRHNLIRWYVPQGLQKYP